MATFYLENVPHGKRRDGTKIDTRKHYAYIAREGVYEGRHVRYEDLAFKTSGNVPIWAKDVSEFWAVAEEHRRKNGRAYREIRLGLQEELSLAENIAVVEAFIKETGIAESHVYSYAIHDKPASFDPSHRNIHCHLMFNEKILESDRPLDRDMFFTRYSKNQDGALTSGYKSDEKWKLKETTISLRQTWERVVNQKFKEMGKAERIDCRNLVEQRKDLLQQGREEEAELLDRKPCPHMGRFFRSPKVIKKFSRFVKMADFESRNPEMAKDFGINDTGKMSSVDLKLAELANDFLMRKLAREIQLERQRQMLEQHEREERETLEIETQIEEEPYIVTIGDLVEEAEKNCIILERKMQHSLEQYLKHKKGMMSEEELKPMYREYVITKKQYESYQKHIEDLKRASLDAVVYTSKMVSIVDYNTRLEDGTRVGDAPIVSYGRESYALWKEESKHNLGVVQAVKLGDVVNRGRVPIYTFRVSEREVSGMKSYRILENLTDTSSRKSMRVYPANKAGTGRKQDNKRVKTIRHRKGVAVRQKMSKMLNKILATKERTGKFVFRWNEDEHEEKDKAMRKEKEMARGWSL